MKHIDEKNLIILFDARVLTHKIYTGVENYAKIILEGILTHIKVDVVKPNTTNKCLSHLWLHFVLPLKKQNILFCPANIAPFYLPKSKKLILTLHDLSFITQKETFSKLMRWYYLLVIPFNIKKATRVITGSNYSKKEIERYFPNAKGKIEVIYHGLNPIFKRLKGINKKNQILYVGSLNKRKNFIGLLKMFEKLNDENYTLKIVGNFSSNFYLDETTKKLINKVKQNKNIHFLENVKNEDLVILYNESKLFIYPSFYEGFGFPVLEAMGCGVPVLCSNTTSLPEVGGDAALYIDPNDPNDILDKTKQILYDDFLQKKMLNQGYIQSQKFIVKSMIKKHLKVLKKVAYEK